MTIILEEQQDQEIMQLSIFKKINFDYLTFLDQDDKLNRKFLIKIHDCLSSNIKIDAINSNYHRKSLIKKKK